jgi:LuxR family maltose regulon positive regulatory protein
VKRLDEGLSLGHRLTLISAPAGFGKTTLLSEWVQAMGEATPPIAVAWLSLDASDNDPTRFLTYFIAALQTIEARQEPAAQQEPVGVIGKGALSALQSPQPPPTEALLTSLINEIADISDRIILVLDDYHLIESSPADDALAFLLEHLPPQMHLVIATREDPRLALAGLRARGQLTELRAADLRFTSSEAAEFLNQAMDLDLSAEDIAALETRTEGWIAGLQLAAISMQGHKDTASLIKSFTGSHRFVLDYLIEEVLEQQPESVQFSAANCHPRPADRLLVQYPHRPGRRPGDLGNVGTRQPVHRSPGRRAESVSLSPSLCRFAAPAPAPKPSPPFIPLSGGDRGEDRR